MKFIDISAKDRLDALYMIASASGSTCYEEIASDYTDSLREYLGYDVFLNYEAISDEDMKELLEYIAEED